jgi:hypothetical protein
MTSDNAAMVPPTLASGVVACRLPPAYAGYWPHVAGSDGNKGPISVIRRRRTQVLKRAERYRRQCARECDPLHAMQFRLASIAQLRDERPGCPLSPSDRDRPLDTAGDRCLWHAGGTAGENDDACTWRRRFPGPGWRMRSPATTASLAEPRGSRQVGHQASASRCSLELLYCAVDVGLAGRCHQCFPVGVREPLDRSQSEEGGTKYPPFRIRPGICPSSR